LAAKFNLTLRNIDNIGGGCMGMCQENVKYRLEIQKKIEGRDDFVRVHQYERKLRNSNELLQPFVVPI